MIKISSWIHVSVLVGLCYGVQQVWDYSLETAIVLFLFYEVGGSIPLIDETVSFNEKFIKILRRITTFGKKGKKGKKHAKRSDKKKVN